MKQRSNKNDEIYEIQMRRDMPLYREREGENEIKAINGYIFAKFTQRLE